jgi:predicted AAA+ superfamily ATPase
MSIEKEMAKLKSEVIDKTEYSFRVIKKVDDVGEHLVAYIGNNGSEFISINKKDYKNRVIICYVKEGYLPVFYP